MANPVHVQHHGIVYCCLACHSWCERDNDIMGIPIHASRNMTDDVTFYAKMDHVPKWVNFSSRLKILSGLCFKIILRFVKNYPLPTFLCKMGAPCPLNHPCKAFTSSHSSPSCIAYNGVSITWCFVTMATETVALDRSKRIPAQMSLQTKANYKDALLLF